MDKQRKTRAPTSRRGANVSAKGSLGDAATQQLLKAGQAGNSALVDQLNAANGQRDELLRFILSRIRSMHDTQLAEVGVKGERNDWMRDVFKGAETLPEPGRWVEPAELYRKAVLALCSGQLGRGAQYAEEAIELEEAAMAALPDAVRHAVEAHQLQQEVPASPQVAEEASPNSTCGRRSRPQDLALADDIINQNTVAEHVGLRAKQTHSWWDEEEESLDDDGETA